MRNHFIYGTKAMIILQVYEHDYYHDRLVPYFCWVSLAKDLNISLGLLHLMLQHP